MSLVTDEIKGYVEQNKSDLIAKAVLGGNIVDRFSLMVGVNGPTTINLMNSDIVPQDGSTCGFSPEGDHNFTQRVIEPAILKVNMEYCPKDFLGTYAAYQVKLGAGKETLPYQEKYINDVIANINLYNEDFVFNGNANGDQKGIIDLYIDAMGGAKQVTASTAYDFLLATYMDANENVLSKNNLEMYVSPAFYRDFVQDLVAKNMYHYNANDTAEYTYLPGTKVKVIPAIGLNGATYAILTDPANIVVGVDQASDKEDFKFWYSDDNDTFRLKVNWAIGVQIAFPDEMVVAEWKA